MTKEQFEKVAIRLIFFVLFLCASNAVVAETVWCKMFNAGCITEEQKIKQMRHCEQMGHTSYAEGLNEALADPTVWQLAGKNSAQSYARMRQRGMVAICLKMSSPHDF